MKPKSNPKAFAFLTSLLVCILIFSVFAGQALWSDIVTFHKSGDDLKGSFPAVKKIADYLQQGVFSGADIDTFNGATEFFSRSNIANQYVFVVLASCFMKLFPARGVYVALYLLQLFFCSYFSIRLGQTFFQMKNRYAFLFACSWIAVALYEYWYLSFYIATTLVPMVLYLELKIFETYKIRCKECLLYSFPYVLSITSGYITVSLALACGVFVMTACYGILYRKLHIKDTLRKVAAPFVLGVGVCLPFCLELTKYRKNVVQATSATIHDALGLKLNALDVKRIVSGAFENVASIEQMGLITLDMFWVFILVLLIYLNIIQKMEYADRILLRFGIGINTLFLMIALGNLTPFAAWFYSFVPILGSMHLPLRYLMVTLILLYLGLAVSLPYLPDLKQKKGVKIAAFVVFLTGFMCTMIAPYLFEPKINMEQLVVELFLFAAILYVTYRYGMQHFGTVILSAFFILLPAINYFYNANEIGGLASDINERSIVYDIARQDRLDELVSDLEKKERYLYAAFDSVESVPEFIPGNYGWYGYSKYHLANYSGYELHLSVPTDYLQRFLWFDSMDWGYIANTRGDFLILDQPSIDANRDALENLVDWDESGAYLDTNHQFLKLKKFIPSYYTGEYFVEDKQDTMDNGYFYCPEMKNEDLTEFRTDRATYFQAQIDARADCSIAFLLYPNKNYHYYVNGKEVQPSLQDMQAYIPVSKGKNVIQVIYKNNLDKVKNVIFLVYYCFLAVSLAIVVVRWVQKRNREKRI